MSQEIDDFLITAREAPEYATLEQAMDILERHLKINGLPCACEYLKNYRNVADALASLSRTWANK